MVQLTPLPTKCKTQTRVILGRDYYCWPHSAEFTQRLWFAFILRLWIWFMMVVDWFLTALIVTAVYAACSKGFVYKYVFAVLGSASCHLLFIARLLLFALFFGHCGTVRRQTPVTALSPNCSGSITPFKLAHLCLINPFCLQLKEKLCNVDNKYVFDYAFDTVSV